MNTQSADKKATHKKMLRRSHLFEKYGMLIIFVVIFVACSIASPYFLKVRNLLNVSRQVSIIGIISIGMTFVIIIGGIDLSVGSMLALSTLIVAGMKVYGAVPSLLLALVITAAAGAVTGVIITKGKVQPFIVTLGMMTILVGIGLTYSEGHPLIGINEKLLFIGQGEVGPVPVQTILFAVVAIIGAVILNYTRIGRYIFAIGGNQEGSRLSGIAVDRVKIIVYTLSGALSGFAGAIMSAHLNIGEANLGSGLELDAIAAVVVGGTSLSGGQGSIGGTVIGVLIIGMINNFLNLINVPGYTQKIVKGVIIVGAVLIQSVQSSRRK